MVRARGARHCLEGRAAPSQVHLLNGRLVLGPFPRVEVGSSVSWGGGGGVRITACSVNHGLYPDFARRTGRTRRVERIHRYGILREDRRGMKESAVKLSAVEAVAHADAVRPSRCTDADAAAPAAAGEALGSFHAHPALRR